MKEIDFLELVSQELELEESLDMNSSLVDYDEWDSIGAMVVIGLISSHYGVIITGEELENITTANDLINLIKSKL